jgi:hypothetical protein
MVDSEPNQRLKRSQTVGCPVGACGCAAAGTDAGRGAGVAGRRLATTATSCVGFFSAKEGSPISGAVGMR